MPTTVQAGVAATVVFLLLVAFRLGGGSHPRVVEIVSALFIPMLSLVFVPLSVSLAATAAPGRIRAAWVAMSVALVSWALAEWTWAYNGLVIGRTPRPSWADAAYLFAIPTMGAALLLFPSARSWRAQSRVILDGLILTVSFFVISWLAVVRRAWHGHDAHGADFALALFNPIADFLVLAVGFLVLLKVAPGLRTTLTLLVAALSCGAISDSVWAYSARSQDYTPGGSRFLLAAAAGLLIIVALVAAHNTESGTAEVAPSPSQLTLWLPLLPLLVAGMSLVLAPNAVVTEAPVVIAVVVLIVATLVRQMLEAAEAVRREKEIRLLAGRLTHDLDSAAKYVASILPGDVTGPVQVSSRYLPSRAVGGDSFGYEWIDDCLVFYLIDVSGHGVEPALFSVSVHNLLRSGSLPAATLLAPDEVLGQLNELFNMESHAYHYFTIWYGVYQLPTRRLRYASAGHPPALVLARDGATVTAIPLTGGSTPVGMFDDSTFAVESYHVPADARILLYSDGVLGDPPQTAKFSAVCTEWAVTPSASLDALVSSLEPLADGEGDDADDRSLVLLTFSR